ncbi:hypothetical protein BCEN4_370042 [Burkholderia cenocepacia]|nr:hypothetical protein BCEN4_370042 [Burkholderia cenocepacia]
MSGLHIQDTYNHTRTCPTPKPPVPAIDNTTVPVLYRKPSLH